MNKKNRMIYLADDELVEKIKVMRDKYQLNISAVIRNHLLKTYKQLEESHKDKREK